MNKYQLSVAALLVLLAGQSCSSVGAEAKLGHSESEERRLIAVVQSDASLKEKDAACAALKRIGTTQCIPALARLLTDEQLSHSARYALESMTSTEAGQVLVHALDKTSGLTKAGIINSLGIRQEKQGVAPLKTLLADSDSVVAAASASALGQIATPEALSALEAIRPNSTGPVHDAVVDGCLRCANQLLASGAESKARAAFDVLYATEKKDGVRVAAFRGLILASGKQSLSLMTEAIGGQRGPSQIAALQLVSEVTTPGATKVFAGILPKLSPSVQVAVIEGLGQRNDPIAAGAVAAMVASPSPDVRLAAINALGVLGDATAVPILAGPAASGPSQEQSAARLALVQLRHGEITKALLAQLSSAKPAVQAEIARVLADRGETAAIPKLLQLAESGPISVRTAAYQGLTLLVDQEQLPSLVSLVSAAKEDATRAQAAEALNSACQRILAKRGHLDASSVVRQLKTGSVETRAALLPVCSGLVDPDVRTTLRAGIADADPIVRSAAIRALCDTRDVELLPEVTKLACAATEDNLRTLAIGACVRLATQEETIKLDNSKRLEIFKTILNTPLRVEQKRLLLAGLAEVPHREALKLVEPFLGDATVQTEAARAAIKIATGLPRAENATAVSVLNKVLAGNTGATRQAAEAGLKQIEARK